jgi:hypothetical protein
MKRISPPAGRRWYVGVDLQTRRGYLHRHFFGPSAGQGDDDIHF